MCLGLSSIFRFLSLFLLGLEGIFLYQSDSPVGFGCALPGALARLRPWYFDCAKVAKSLALLLGACMIGFGFLSSF